MTRCEKSIQILWHQGKNIQVLCNTRKLYSNFKVISEGKIFKFPAWAYLAGCRKFGHLKGTCEGVYFFYNLYMYSYLFILISGDGTIECYGKIFNKMAYLNMKMSWLLRCTYHTNAVYMIWDNN